MALKGRKVVEGMGGRGKGREGREGEGTGGKEGSK